MSRWSPLNPRQLEVLRWVADGCPDGLVEGSGYKNTAIALQSRGLVAVSKKGGVWRAEISEAGRYYLEHGEYPASASRPAAAGPAPSARPRPRPQPEPRAARPAKSRTSPTEQLIADLQAAGGELRINRREDSRDYRQLVSAAIRFHKVPDGKLLTLEAGSRWEELIVRLQDPPEWMSAELVPVPVPRQLRRPHQILARLRDDDRFALTSTVRNRGLRLLEGLLRAALARGYAATPASGPHQGRRPEPQLFVRLRGHRIGVLLRQEIDRRRHEVTEVEQRRLDRDRWYRASRFDETPSRRLSIELIGGQEHRRSVWADSDKRALEDCLAEILQEIELRAVAAEAERLAGEARAAEQERQWRQAMTTAQERLQEHQRAQTLQAQANQWKEANELSAFLDAVQLSLASLADDVEADRRRRWLEWGRRYVGRLDPLQGRLGMPDEIEATSERLRPFLDGWSPHSPTRDPRW